MNADSVLWAIGDHGTLMYSPDGGQNWSLKDLPINASLLDITFYRNRGWIVGSEGMILFSTDDGQTWKKQQSGTLKNLHKVDFVDPNCGWILTADSVILRTLDGGGSWEAIIVKHPFFTSSYWPLNDIEFINPDKGWLAVGYYQSANLDILPYSWGALFKTIDGGVSWTIVDSGKTMYRSLFFLNEFKGWIVTDNVETGPITFRTEDGGETWGKNTGLAFNWDKIYFADSLNGWGIFYDYLGKTIDGGETWSLEEIVDPFVGNIRLKGLFYKNSTTGWLVGTSGSVLKTTDSGDSWNHQDFRLDIFFGALNDVVFTDEKEGWIVGEQLRSDPAPDSSIVLHTTDGGISWERQSVPSYNAIRRIRSIDNQRLWAIGGRQLFFTTNGGKSWHQANFIIENEILREIFFMDEITGFLLSDKTIYKTSDGGSSWPQLTNEFDVQFLRRLCFSDKLNGWLLGKKNVFEFPTYRTTDGGQTWYRVTLNFTAITFLNSLIGFAINNGSVYRSSDGGNNWKQICENPAFNVSWTSNMTFADTTHGWIWDHFDLYHTTDGGRTWQIENGISKIQFVFPGGLFMLNKNLGWAVGSDGIIFKYESDNITSAIIPTREACTGFRLFPNYPNPFNSTTTINYFLPFQEEIEISIFNVLGKKVKVLFSGIKIDGLHQIEFDGGDLSSGIYFYQLRTKSFIGTNKTLVIK